MNLRGQLQRDMPRPRTRRTHKTPRVLRGRRRRRWRPAIRPTTGDRPAHQGRTRRAAQDWRQPEPGTSQDRTARRDHTRQQPGCAATL